MNTATIETECESCGVTFEQPYDPGKRRQYCSNACRQRAYRARGGRASGTRYQSDSARARREYEEAFAREEARRERERQRSQQRRGARNHDTSHRPHWCHERHTDSAEQRKMRAKAALLMDRACHASTPEHEANAARVMADRIRAKYGL
jgi:hypothetical protein